ncbi:MAG: hypothetical protein WCK39_09725, partial [Methanomassiliicoccales archaeon]
MKQGLISTSEAKTIMGDGAKAKTALWRLTQKGSLLRVKEGLYAAIPPGAYPPNYEIDRYLVVNHLLPGAGVLAYHTALEI